MVDAFKQCRGGTLHLVKIPGKYKVMVAKIAGKALAGISELLAHRKPVETVIFSSIPEFVVPEVGIGAHATMQGDIVVNINFSRRDIKKVIQKELPSTIYHEFSHVVRASVHESLYATLGKSLVTEGIASYIEKGLFQKKVPYVEPIKNERKYWLQAQKIMRKSAYDHGEWFYGTKKLPRWIGYRLGYLIVKSFVERQKNVSFARLVRINSSDVLKEFKI